MEIILLDTNVLIEILKNNKETINRLESIKSNFAISVISAMELFYGALNNKEMIRLNEFVSVFKIYHLTLEISQFSLNLIKKYSKSHNLDIPDSLIASTAICNNIKLFTYNLKDFRFINNLNLL